MTEAFAAEIAPHIDNATTSIHHAVGPTGGQLVRTAGLPRAGLLVDLLVPLLAGPAEISALHRVERYTPYEKFSGTIDEHVTQGMLSRSGNIVVATPPGLELLTDLRHAQGLAITVLWSDRLNTVSTLRPLVDRVLNSVDDDGPAFALLKPPAQAESTAQELHDRITALRYYRADAHAAAWTAAGLTAAEIPELTGPERDRIEAETNRLAARPYVVLNDDERGAFLDAIKVLAD
jgi:hypothetical protein